MRKNLKKQIVSMVNKLGPEVIEDFEQKKIVHRDDGMKRVGSNLAEALQGSANLHSYYHQIELNNVFESLNITFQDVSHYMEGLENELTF